MNYDWMICSICKKTGIYWKDLYTGNPFTYCPNCKNKNCQIKSESEKQIEEENEE